MVSGILQNWHTTVVCHIGTLSLLLRPAADRTHSKDGTTFYRRHTSLMHKSTVYSQKPAYFGRILDMTWDYFGSTGKFEKLERYTIALALLATTACAMALY